MCSIMYAACLPQRTTTCAYLHWRTLAQVAPIGLLIEKAGGASSADGKQISALDVPINSYDQRTEICYGSVGEVRGRGCVLIAGTCSCTVEDERERRAAGVWSSGQGAGAWRPLGRELHLPCSS
jgi:hypothetical protein